MVLSTSKETKMQTRDKEEIRQAVRERYGKVARSGDPTTLADLDFPQ